jgi:hypothetical protein
VVKILRSGVNVINFTSIARGSGFQPRKKVALWHRGWKPLPQSQSHKLPLLNFLGSNDVSVLIKLAAFQAGGGAGT